jgi:predicted neuraminidase
VIDQARVAREFVTLDDARYPQCHASTVLVIGDELHVAWFGGTAEGTPDNRIWSSHRPSDGDAWSPPEVLAGDGSVAHWNPVLAEGPDGATWLFYKRGGAISSWQTYVRRLRRPGGPGSPGNAAWTAEAELVAGDRGGRGPVKNPPLLVPPEPGTTPGTGTGTPRWLAPASLESGTRPARWDAFVDVSDDAGATWVRHDVSFDHAGATGAGVIQPSLWRSGSAFGMLMRSSEGVAYRSTSPDGENWSEAHPTGLANNNSGLSVVALPDGRLACAHNPVSGDWAPRCPLSVSVSDDDGVSWRRVLELDDGVTPLGGEQPSLPPERADGGFAGLDTGVVTDGVGEYSYPTAIVHGAELLVSYTWQRRGIVLAHVPLGALPS